MRYPHSSSSSSSSPDTVATPTPHHLKKNRNNKNRKQQHVLIFFLGCGFSFYLGTLWAFHFGNTLNEHDNVIGGGNYHRYYNPTTIKQEKRDEEQRRNLQVALDDCQQQIKKLNNTIIINGEIEDQEKQGKQESESAALFPNSVSNYAHSMATVSKQKFFNRFDIGVAMDESSAEDKDVLILYNGKESQPHNISPNSVQYIDDIGSAIENCDFMNIMLLHHKHNRKQCVAMVPNYEAFHIYRYGRVGGGGNGGDDTNVANTAIRNIWKNLPINSGYPLQIMSRGYEKSGTNTFLAPSKSEIIKNWNMVQKFLQSQEDIMGRLKPILQSIAVDNTVIVMVCNFGQSELLMNFVCHAKARYLDMSMIIVFATDSETHELAQGLGLTSFYEERIFGDLSKEEAEVYGDRRFVEMMYGKSICVTYVSMLGFDFLFQDVDIIWYRHPFDFFHKKLRQTGNFDKYELFFQDDGGRSQRYAPLSANSGFYYVRHNERTQWLMSSILFSGEVIQRCNSHQQLFIAKMNEFVSYLGLKVKVFSRSMEEFPSGYHFHQTNKRYMKAFFEGKRHPILFHMCWTKNKDDKILFFRQMGGWYVRDRCIHRTAQEIMPMIAEEEDNNNAAKTSTSGNVASFCCSVQPNISCHYRDKPSIKPCKNSPPIDPGTPSWWS